MVDVIEVNELPEARRRIDPVMAAAVTVSVDAALFVVVAVAGVPFLMFVFADESGTWQRLWPYVGTWVIACVSGAGTTAAAFVLARSSTRFARLAGATAALGAGVAGVLVSLLMWHTEIVLLAAVFGLANLLAAYAFLTAKDPSFAPFEPAPLPQQAFPTDFAPAFDEADELYRRPAPATASQTKMTIDLQVHPRPRPDRRRPRAQAALHTLRGVQLPPRARRTHPAR
ncbi:hypothetical protein [Paractinoplanes deccanensis]|nr:hypothetical protein [Actinoplanes deccanensis]